jgi:hypothetical protein
VRRLDFGDVAVLVGADAETLAGQASVVRQRELRRVAIFVLDTSAAGDCAALEAFCSEQFGARP